MQDWVVETLITKLSRGRHVKNLVIIMIESTGKLRVEQGASFRRMKQRRRFVRHEKRRRQRGSLRFVSDILYMNQELRHSFVSELLTLLFGVVYGITQIVVDRRDVPPGGLAGSQNTMGFGQLVPLFLLALPVLAGAEVYFGTH